MLILCRISCDLRKCADTLWLCFGICCLPHLNNWSWRTWFFGSVIYRYDATCLNGIVDSGEYSRIAAQQPYQGHDRRGWPVEQQRLARHMTTLMDRPNCLIPACIQMRLPYIGTYISNFSFSVYGVFGKPSFRIWHYSTRPRRIAWTTASIRVCTPSLS